ncbi:MAG: single-stranded DNA-binding protein [Saprospiraceae bacterium]
MIQKVNKVSLAGHLGKDPIIKTFDSGARRATILLATRDTYQNSVGRSIESVQWHRLTAWGRTAEQIEKMLHKGNFVKLEGRLHHYKINMGEVGTKTYYEIVVDRFEMMLEQQRA